MTLTTRTRCAGTLLLAAILLPLSPGALAATYVIAPDGSGDFPTIALAVEAAQSGDVIELTDGTFSGSGNRDISLGGKSLIIRSRSGVAEACVIDCGDTDRAFGFIGGEGAGAMIAHLTIANGSASHGGAVICAGFSNPILRDCVFRNCSALVGGGVYCNESHPLIERCLFEGNEASIGGGLACRNYAGATALTCTFVGNLADRGGAVSSDYNSWPTVTGCTLHANDAASGSGIYCAEEGTLRAENSIIAFGLQGRAVHCVGGTVVALSCCDVHGNEGGDWVGCISGQLGIDGNIDDEPAFCDAAGGNLALTSDSPCVHFSLPNDGCDLIGAWGVGCGHHLVTADGGGDFPTIQAAVDALSDGDVICLDGGTFTGEGNRDVDFGGKALRILPLDVQAPPPVVDCAAAGNGFRFQSGEGPASVLSGCIITGGLATSGGGILCRGASPSISRCILRGNTADDGGGIHCGNGAAPRIVSTVLLDNSAAVSGGGISCAGGAVPSVSRSTLAGNSAPQGGGIACHDVSGATLDHTIIAFAADGAAVHCEETNPVTLACCDLFGNAGGDWTGCIAGQLGLDGNLAEDPLFCDLEALSAEGLTLDDRSVCLPLHPYNTCGQIGARPQGCHVPMTFVIDPDGGGDFATIAEAIAFSRPGDIIELSDGIFVGPGNRALAFGGKSLILRSAGDDPTACVIDCESQDRGFALTRGEGPSAQIRGITVRNGRATAG